MKLSTQIILAFSLIILLSVIDSYTNYLLSLKVARNTEFLSNSESVIRNSNRLHKAMIEMQSAFRGYLLTDDTTFLHLYHKGKEVIPGLYTDQLKLVRDNEWQYGILDTIYRLHTDWLTYSEALIDAKRRVNANQEQASDYQILFETRLKKQVGKKLNDEITERFVQFDRNEYRTRNMRSSQLSASIKRTHFFSSVFLTLTIIIGVVSGIYIVRLILRRITSMVSLAEDITKGKFSIVKDDRNDELTSLSNSLNIMSDRLSKNIHELENRNAELNKFAYVVSHDLKAPVRGIHNVVKWIEEDLGHELSPQLRNYLEIIPQRTKRMEDLINGLLDYARISEKTQIEKVNVNEMIKEITDSIVPRDFEVKMDNLPTLETERLKLEQIFTNLISNSVKYTPQPNGHITVSCRELADHYEFSVKDDGIGIDPEYHDKIFEIFQTLREKDEKESTGIGLAIIKKIIDEHQCRIWVKSTAGNGAEFIFTWPKTTLKS